MEQFFSFLILLVYVVGVAWIVGLYDERRNPRTFPSRLQRIKDILRELRYGAAVCIPIFALLLNLRWLQNNGGYLIDKVVRTVGSGRVEVLVGMLVIGLGAGAYYFKRKRQWEYGSVEIIFSGAATIVALANVDRHHFMNTLATLAGCVYVSARGYANMGDGWNDKEARGAKRNQQAYIAAVRLKSQDDYHRLSIEEAETSGPESIVDGDS
jgi:hypothetical protein